MRTLYDELGERAVDGRNSDPGRTEKTTAKETIDNDLFPASLYLRLAVPSAIDGDEIGRTLETKAIETVDRDRHAPNRSSALLGPPSDLYSALSDKSKSHLSDRGRTETTEATETMDWDRPPKSFAF